MMNGEDIDIAILGGGLAGGLIALTLAERRPELSIILVEKDCSFGGNHIWSFFASDVDQAGMSLLEPMVAARWDGYDVHFSSHSRHLSTPYLSISSELLNDRLNKALPECALLRGEDVVEAGQDFFRIANGRTFRAGGVIDARGSGTMPHMRGGWQKFVGQMLRLDEPHGLSQPVIMDARVDQIDGFRFVYCLPFSPLTVFVEDTYYSDSPALDRPALRSRIAAYAQSSGWRVREILREETGVLPVIAEGDFDMFWQESGDIAKVGSRAALIHPLTSYSLPIAMRTASRIGSMTDLTGSALANASYDRALLHWRNGGFYRMLTRMLFNAAMPDQRHRILERFYRLPQPLIERFYASQTTRADALRILAGKPPVPLMGALTSLAGRGRGLAALDAPR